MPSVTGRITNITQPRGGYLRRRDFLITELKDDVVLYNQENISPRLIGLAVDYLTRFITGTSPEDAFYISYYGARLVQQEDNAKELLSLIRGLDSRSVDAACKLVGYDVCYRVGKDSFRPVSLIMPDENTIYNIISMVKRGVEFWQIYGPVVVDGFDFEGGYTPVVTSGDGDFLTKDTLWDFKVLSAEIKARHTLQILMYYIMGIHSIYKEDFESLEYLGIFNPRLNKVYRYPVNSISQDIIKTVSHDVIGYDWTEEEYNAFRTKELTSYMEKHGLSDLSIGHTDKTKHQQLRPAAQAPRTPTLYRIGNEVEHTVFGHGRIVDLKPVGGDMLLTIRFEKAGEKRILANIASRFMKIVNT